MQAIFILRSKSISINHQCLLRTNFSPNQIWFITKNLTISLRFCLSFLTPFFLSICLSFYLSLLSLSLCAWYWNTSFFQNDPSKLAKKKSELRSLLEWHCIEDFYLNGVYVCPSPQKKRPTYTMIVRSTINQLVEAVSLRHDQVK